MSSDRKTLEQHRAAHALARVRAVCERSDKVATQYRREADRLAATIVNNGLGQACATLLAKNDDGATQIYDDMGTWLASDAYASPYPGTSSLIDAITQHDQRPYVHAQSEALAWLEWTKKFSRAYIDKETGDDD